MWATMAVAFGPARRGSPTGASLLRRPSVDELGMGADQIAVERRSDVDHVLVERREALALRLRADRKDRDPLEAEVFLLLEQERQAKPEPERGRKAELLSDEVLGLDRDIRGRGRDDDIVEAGRMRQEKVPADLADLDPDERDCVVRPSAGWSAAERPGGKAQRRSQARSFFDLLATRVSRRRRHSAGLIAIPSENRLAAVRPASPSSIAGPARQCLSKGRR